MPQQYVDRAPLTLACVQTPTPSLSKNRRRGEGGLFTAYTNFHSLSEASGTGKRPIQKTHIVKRFTLLDGTHPLRRSVRRPESDIPGGYFRNFWVGMCRWDPGTLNLYQS